MASGIRSCRVGRAGACSTLLVAVTRELLRSEGFLGEGWFLASAPGNGEGEIRIPAVAALHDGHDGVGQVPDFACTQSALRLSRHRCNREETNEIRMVVGGTGFGGCFRGRVCPADE